MKTTLRHLLRNVWATGVLVILLSGITGMTEAIQAQDFDRKTESAVHAMTFTQLQIPFYKTEIKQDISVDFQDMPLEQALREIAREVRLMLSYRGDIMVDKTVSLNNERISVSKALENVLEGTGLDYKFSQNGYLLITETMDFIEEDIYQETVRGRVVDSQSGEALPGVNILIEGTSTGTATDINGEFELIVSSLDETLIFSYIGYQSQTIPIAGRSEIIVNLSMEILDVDEIVVVGYGVQRIRDLTGSVTSIQSRDLQQVPVTTVNQALHGRAPGVMVTQGNAEPGQDARVRIRGFNSIKGDNSPLYVIDGVIDANIDTVNPTDIESITVLKDAASSSIYGARGANGVIIVTTRQGIRGQGIQIEVDHFTGADVPGRTHDMMNAGQYIEFANAAALGNNNPVPYPNDTAVLNAVGDGFNWQDALFVDGIRNRSTMSISGGTESMTFFISGAYENHSAVLPDKGFKRLNARARVEVYPTDKLRFSGNLSYVERERDRSFVGSSSSTFFSPQRAGGEIIRTIYNPPILFPYNEDGSLRSEMSDTFNEVGTPNYPNGLIMKDELRILRNTDLQLTFEGQYNVLENLNYKLSYSTNPALSESRAFRPSYVPGDFFQYRNTASRSFSEGKNQTVENILTYTETIQNHNVTGIIGSTYQTIKSEFFGASDQDFPFNSFSFRNLGTGDSGARGVSSGYSESSWLGYFGRIDYQYDDRYIIQLNARYDGSSFFRPENRWGFFPSAAIGWVISGENFMQNSGIDFLKLRASYGSIGSHATGAFTTLPRVGVSGGDDYSFGRTRVPNFVLSLANPSLTWETTTQFNVGVDLGLISNRLNFTLDSYYKETTDLILDKLTSIVNATERNHEPSILSNLGSMRNHGIDFGVQYNHAFDNGLAWNTNFNFSWQDSEILDLALPEGQTFFTTGDNVNRNIGRLEIGQPIGNYNGWLTDGLWQTQAEIDAAGMTAQVQPGDTKFIDLNGDGLITSADWTVTGNAYPNFLSGLSNSFFYRGLELDIVLSGAFGHQMANVSAAFLKYNLREPSMNKLSEVVDQRWTGPGTSNDIPRYGHSIMQGGTDDGLNGTIDRFVEDASFVKLRNVRLAYNIPNFMGTRNIRLYLQAQNLFIITSYSGYDPETDNFALRSSDDTSLALDAFTYPFVRSYSAGITLSF